MDDTVRRILRDLIDAALGVQDHVKLLAHRAELEPEPDVAAPDVAAQDDPPEKKNE